MLARQIAAALREHSAAPRWIAIFPRKRTRAARSGPPPIPITFRVELRQVVPQARPHHVVDALGADGRSARAGPSFAHRVTVLEALAEAAAIATIDVIPPTTGKLLQIAGIRAAR